MADLTTQYLGLKLENPVVASSSGLTDTCEKVKKCEDAGAGAVVMKSVFEEQIIAEVSELKAESIYSHPEFDDYLQGYGAAYSMQHYLEEIEKAKKNTSIPVLGSVNCISPGGWVDYVKQIENTGVDGLEINMLIFPSSLNATSQEIERQYLEIFKSIKEVISIPVAVKLPPYLTNPGHLIHLLYQAGAIGFVLFNRSLPFDLDIEKEHIKVGNIMSAGQEMSYSLRTISMLSGYIEADFAATTGVHSSESLIKQLFAGASIVQLCTAIYENGPQFINTIIRNLNTWLDSHNYQSVDDIRGKLSQKNSQTPAVYERAQYIKAFANIN